MQKAWKKTILQDVARRAGVSAATASRALSKPEIVSAQTREAVMEAVRETGYSVNQAGRNLRRRRTDCIVALIPNLANPFFAHILSGISAELAPAGYSLLVCDTEGNPDAEGLVMRYLDRGRADGIIMLDGLIPSEHLDDARRTHPLPPAVFACEWIEGTDIPRIRIDNELGARMAVEHLVSLGHRRIAYVSGPPLNILTTTRDAGYRRALKSAGLPVEEDLIFPGDFSLSSGAAAAERWLAMLSPPTAVFCASDAMAAGFISALQRAGRSVPADCSVVGFDDIDVAAHTVPALTTIRQPRREIGRKAAATLLALIAAEKPVDHDQLLPIELMVRGSTARPNSPDGIEVSSAAAPGPTILPAHAARTVTTG